jgi:hypothetical protein
MPVQRPANPTVPIPEARGEDRSVPIPNACVEAGRGGRGATIVTPAAPGATRPVLEIEEP